MATEIELKLRLDPKNIRKLLAGQESRIGSKSKEARHAGVAADEARRPGVHGGHARRHPKHGQGGPR